MPSGHGSGGASAVTLEVDDGGAIDVELAGGGTTTDDGSDDDEGGAGSTARAPG